MLQRVHIQNFKSFRDAEFTFGLNNVLVGPNMSGKSNLFDFFKFVQDLLFPSQSGVYGLNSAFVVRNGFTNVTWKGFDNPTLAFELAGRSEDPTQVLQFSYEVEILGNYRWGNTQVQKERLTLSDEEGEHVLIDTTSGGSRNVFNRIGKQLSSSNDNSRLVLEYEYQDWQGSLVKQAIGSWKFFSLIPAMMRQPNPMTATNTLGRYGENFSAWLMFLQARYPEHFARMRDAVKDVFPSIEGLFSNPTLQSTVSIGSTERGLKRPISVAEMSDGELVFLAMLSLLFSPPEIGADAYFFEEPENHIHPRLLGVLIDLLRQIQQELGPLRGQIFLTTHSPYLVDKVAIEELIVLMKKEGETRAIRPSDQAELQRMIRDENIGLGELYYTGALSFA